MTKTRASPHKCVQNISSTVGFTKTRAFPHKCGQNISSSVGVTKSRASPHKCGQNISSTVGFTKTRASPHKCVQNCSNLLCHNNISRKGNKKNPSFCYADTLRRLEKTQLLISAIFREILSRLQIGYV